MKMDQSVTTQNEYNKVIVYPLYQKYKNIIQWKTPDCLIMPVSKEPQICNNDSNVSRRSPLKIGGVHLLYKGQSISSLKELDQAGTARLAGDVLNFNFQTPSRPQVNSDIYLNINFNSGRPRSNSDLYNDPRWSPRTQRLTSNTDPVFLDNDDYSQYGGQGMGGAGPIPQRLSPRTQRFGSYPQTQSPRTQRFGSDPQRYSPRTQRFGSDPQRQSPRTQRFESYPQTQSPRPQRFGSDPQRYSPRTPRFGSATNPSFLDDDYTRRGHRSGTDPSFLDGRDNKRRRYGSSTSRSYLDDDTRLRLRSNTDQSFLDNEESDDDEDDEVFTPQSVDMSALSADTSHHILHGPSATPQMFDSTPRRPQYGGQAMAGAGPIPQRLSPRAQSPRLSGTPLGNLPRQPPLGRAPSQDQFYRAQPTATLTPQSVDMFASSADTSHHILHGPSATPQMFDSTPCRPQYGGQAMAGAGPIPQRLSPRTERFASYPQAQSPRAQSPRLSGTPLGGLPRQPPLGRAPSQDQFNRPTATVHPYNYQRRAGTPLGGLPPQPPLGRARRQDQDGRPTATVRPYQHD